MPLYEYRCTNFECGIVGVIECSYSSDTKAILDTGQVACRVCGVGCMRRVYGTFSIKPNMVQEAHLNTAAGKVVRNDREFKDALKKQGDEMAERLGMDVNYEPVDWREKEAFGVTEEGLENTRRKEVEVGKRQVKIYQDFSMK